MFLESTPAPGWEIERFARSPMDHRVGSHACQASRASRACGASSAHHLPDDHALRPSGQSRPFQGRGLVIAILSAGSNPGPRPTYESGTGRPGQGRRLTIAILERGTERGEPLAFLNARLLASDPPAQRVGALPRRISAFSSSRASVKAWSEAMPTRPAAIAARALAISGLPARRALQAALSAISCV